LYSLLCVGFSLILVVSDIPEAGVKPEKHQDYHSYQQSQHCN
jgi:hypothetical protein